MRRTWIVVAFASVACALPARSDVVPVQGGDQVVAQGFGITSNDVAVDLDTGAYVVVWTRDEDGIYGLAFDDDVHARIHDAEGEPVGGDFLVHAYTTARQRHPRVEALPEGFVVVWEGVADPELDGVGEDHLMLRRLDWQGAPLGSEEVVESDPLRVGLWPTVAGRDDGSFEVAWTAPYVRTNVSEVWVRRFASDGSAMGTERPARGSSIGLARNVEIATAPDGAFNVVWGFEQLDDVVVRRFDASGEPIGGEILVNPESLGEKYAGDPDIAFAEDGGFVVTWEAEDPRESDPSRGDRAIKARRYGPDGLPVGEVMRLNAETARGRQNPSIARAADGSFLVTWHRYANAGDGTIGQRLSPAGVERGAEFVISDNDGFPLSYPRVAPGPGGFRTSWSSKRTAEVAEAAIVSRGLSITDLFADGFDEGHAGAWSLVHEP